MARVLLLAEAKEGRARARLDPSSISAGKRPLADVRDDFLRHHGDSPPWDHPGELGAGMEPAHRAGLRFGAGRKLGVLAVKDFLADLERRGVGAATRHK